MLFQKKDSNTIGLVIGKYKDFSNYIVEIEHSDSTKAGYLVTETEYKTLQSGELVEYKIENNELIFV
ncbi:MAG: hypothetical protein LBD38_04930 [Streptococcaceae bacterium]|jgi:hypothetical protein|nr:hypothetical protein [Streptococcaceae bacterium]